MIYKVNPNIQWERVADKENDDSIVFNVETDDVLVINNTAFAVLDKINQNLDMVDIISQLAEEYNCDSVMIENDVRSIISQMEENELIFKE